jgi:hypothetical protein
MSRIKRKNIIIGTESLLLQLKIQAHTGAKYNTNAETMEAKQDSTIQLIIIRNTTTD